MLVSLILMRWSLPETTGSRLLENCERLLHQREAARKQLSRRGSRHYHEGTRSLSVDRRAHPDAALKQIAAAADAREPDLHTDIGDRTPFESQQMPGALDPGVNAELVRRLAEHRAKLPNEMERRHRRFTRHDVQPDRDVVYLAEHVASAA